MLYADETNVSTFNDAFRLSTGLRALDHAVENLYRPLVTPPIKALCYQALRDLFENLPKSKANPQDVAVRQKLQLASWMSLWPMKLEKYRYVALWFRLYEPIKH